MSDQPLFNRPFAALTAAHFLQALGYSSMILLPLYLDNLGASRTEIGTYMSVGAIGGLLARPLVGWAIDVWGRKRTILVGTALLVCSLGLVGFVEALGGLIYLVRVLFGLGAGALFTGYFAFAADLIPVERRAEGIALFGISGLLPLLVNPLSAAIGVEGPDIRFFLPAVGVVICLSVPLVLAVPERRSQAEAEPFRAGAVASALGARPLWSVWLATTVFSGLVAVFMSFASVAAEKRGIFDPTVIWLGYPLAAASIRLFGARLPDRVGTHNIVLPSLGVYIGALVLLAQAETQTDYLFAGILGGLGHGSCFPVLTAQVVSRVPDSMRGSGLAMFTALWGVTEIVFAPAFGWFADVNGDAAMFSGAALVSVVAMGLWVVWEHGVTAGGRGG